MPHLSIALVGLGKIAHDQHLPAIAASPQCELVATADPNAALDTTPAYASLEEMLDAEPRINAVAICTPTHLRYSQARLALLQGKHVLLEKPPGATLSEVEDLKVLAERQGVSLLAAWHSRFAPGVASAKRWLASQTVRRVDIEWKEDVRLWHPGQAWIWQPGGMGVFDPGINALSIATEILPAPFFLRNGKLQIPANGQTPIAAALTFTDANEAALNADFDFRQPDPPIWNITVETEAGHLELTHGGRRLDIAGETVLDAEEQEYVDLYQHFASLTAHGKSDMDISPLRHVADAFLYGYRETVDAFEE